MKKLIVLMLLISPLVNAEQFLEFTKHTHHNGTIHFTNVPGNGGENYIISPDFANAQAIDQMSRESRMRVEARKQKRDQIKKESQLRQKVAYSKQQNQLKEQFYRRAKEIVDRGIVAGEADYTTDADAYALRKKRYSLKDKQAAKHFVNEANARVQAGNIALKDNRPDYAWNHGLHLRSLSYYTPDNALSAKLYRQGSELMSSATRQMDSFRAIVREYEAGETEHWEVSEK